MFCCAKPRNIPANKTRTIEDWKSANCATLSPSSISIQKCSEAADWTAKRFSQSLELRRSHQLFYTSSSQKYASTENTGRQTMDIPGLRKLWQMQLLMLLSTTILSPEDLPISQRVGVLPRCISIQQVLKGPIQDIASISFSFGFYLLVMFFYQKALFQNISWKLRLRSGL